ncbi:IS1595 family transposase [candidate division KSB1 bacterium]
MSRNKLSKYYRRKIISCFALEFTATQTARLLKISRNTINRHYRQIRISIAAYQDHLLHQFTGEIELDESYFGGRHKGNIGRSTKSKIPVFGILKRNGYVYTQIVPDVSSRTLKSIIKQRVSKGSKVFSDSWKSYDGLVLYGYEHVRINHNKELVDKDRNHINGIESFWAYVKNKLVKYYGIKPELFYLYLKEHEFRFNNRNKDIEKLLFNLMRQFKSL